MMIKNSTKMVEVANAGGQALVCWMKKCGRNIAVLEKYFLDTLWDRIYCHQCGLCLRYARKKAMERGEQIETAEVES
jgi:hypothetical protein